MTFARVKPAGWTDDIDTITGAQLNALDTNVSQAVDGAAGGSYSPAGVINITGSGIGTTTIATKLTFSVGSQLVYAVGADIPDGNNQTFALSGGQIRRFLNPGGNHEHDLSTTGAVAGSWIHFIRSNSANTITIRRSGFAGDHIVVLPSATWSTATVYYDGANWRLMSTIDGSPGNHA